MLIVCKGFSKERMSGLSAWRCVCDCINITAIVVHSEHLIQAAQKKLLIWMLFFPISRYIHQPALTLELPMSLSPNAHSYSIPVRALLLLLATALIRVLNSPQ